MLCSRCNTDAKRSLSLFFMSSYYGSICYPCTSDLILQFHTTNHTTYTALLVYYAGCSAVLCFYYYRLVSDPYRGNDSWGISFLPSSLSSSSLLYMSSSLASHFVPFGQRPKQQRRVDIGIAVIDQEIKEGRTDPQSDARRGSEMFLYVIALHPSNKPMIDVEG